MTTTAMGLAIAAITTGAVRSISLLDAMISSYLLVLPLITATYAMARLTEYQRITSPLLVIVDTVRLLLTTAFGVWMWATAPHFGKQPACNNLIFFVFFGAKLRATSVAARTIGLIFWTSSGALFLFHRISSMDTFFLSIKALFSTLAAKAFRLPRRTGPADQVRRFSSRIDISIAFGLRVPLLLDYPVFTWDWGAEFKETKRPTREFHSPDLIMPREILDSQVGPVIRWIFLAIALLSFAFVLIMVELALYVDNPGIMLDKSFGFGQVRFA